MAVASIALLVPCLMAAASKYSELDGRIVNGIPISSDQYPWMVSLRAEVTEMSENATDESTTTTTSTSTPNGGGTHFSKTNFFSDSIQNCGASLIALSPPTILTAAHCLDGIFDYGTNTTTYTWFADINRTYDIINTPNDTYYTLPIYADNIHVHPKWNWSAFEGYDIALFISNESLTETAQAKLAPYLPTISTVTPCCEPNEDLTIMGYGTMSTGGNDSTVLRTTNMRYMNNINCSQQLVNIILDSMLINGSLPQNLSTIDAGWDLGIDVSNITTIDELVDVINEYVMTTDVYDDRVICIIGNNTDACHGDSGGPLFKSGDDIYDIKLLGVTSFGPDGECNSGTFTAYTNIASYYEWIEDVTGMIFVSTEMPETTDIEDVIIYKWKQGLDNVSKVALVIAVAVGWFCALICCICWCRTRSKIMKAQGSTSYSQF